MLFFILQANTGSGIYKDAISENTTYFKLTRNLYFNETVISGNETKESYRHIVFDGNGCSIVGLCCFTGIVAASMEKPAGLWILPYMEESIIHDINFVNTKVNSTLISERSEHIDALNIGNIYIRCTFDITFYSETASFSDPISNLYLPSQFAIESTSYIDNLKRKGNFMGYNIKFKSTSISNEVRFPIVLDASCRGYFKFSGTYLVDEGSRVEDAKISFNLVSYSLINQSIDLSNFVFNGVTECLTSNLSNINSPTSNSVVDYVVESLNSQDAVSKINNNNSSGFIVSKIEGADAPILPSLQVSYEGYARRTDVLEKKNSAYYEPTEDYHPATKKYVDEKAGVKESAVLTRDNTDFYEPTSDYNPATKKYVDNAGFIDKIFLFIDIQNNLVRIQDSSSFYTINTTWQSVAASSEYPGYKKISIQNTHGAYNIIDKIYNYLLDCRIGFGQRKTSLDRYYIKVFLSGTEALHHTMSFNQTQETDDTVFSLGGFYALVSNQMQVPSMIVIPWIEALRIIKSTNSYILADFSYIKFDPTR